MKTPLSDSEKFFCLKKQECDPDDPPEEPTVFDYWWGAFNRMAELAAGYARMFGLL